MHGDDDAADEKPTADAETLTRLHSLGVPVPGIRICVDPKMDATVWLENLEVQCAHKAFADRVRAVLERALDMVDGSVM